MIQAKSPKAITMSASAGKITLIEAYSTSAGNSTRERALSASANQVYSYPSVLHLMASQGLIRKSHSCMVKLERQKLTPRRTMYDAQGLWLQKDSADPLHGWHLKEIQDHHNTHDKLLGLENDLYGHLNSFFRHTLHEVHQKMTNATINFQATSVLAQDLSTTFDDNSFDRVNVSNMADECYLGIHKILKATQPLLQPTNKHATLITLFMNAIRRMESQPQ